MLEALAARLAPRPGARRPAPDHARDRRLPRPLAARARAARRRRRRHRRAAARGRASPSAAPRRSARCTPTPPALDTAKARDVDAAAAHAAAEVVSKVEALLESWSDSAPTVLRAGGLGVRELKRVAKDLDTTERTAALLVEVAAAAGLVDQTPGLDPEWVPTPAYDAWPAATARAALDGARLRLARHDPAARPGGRARRPRQGRWPRSVPSRAAGSAGRAATRRCRPWPRRPPATPSRARA